MQKISSFNHWDIIIVLVIGLVQFIITIYSKRNALPRAYNIAVVGFPKSGKTTLITMFFEYFLSKNILKRDIKPRGSETIERLAEDMEKIRLRKALGPTTDQELFAYRADMTIGSGFFRERYKIQIGDFPGEDSERFINNYGDWLHKTPYFKWVMEADAYIFVVDLSELLHDNYSVQPTYAARMTKAITAAWQHILEYHVDGKKGTENKPLILACCKADIYSRTIEEARHWNAPEHLKEFIRRQSSGENLPPIINIDITQVEEVNRLVRKKFTSLIKYLSQETRYFDIVIASPLALDNKGHHLGIVDLVYSVMPRRRNGISIRLFR